MDQYQTKTLKMMYNDQLEYIDCPKNAKYEDCIEIALARFEIPLKLKKSIKLATESDDVFEKCTFEYYNLLFPSPATIFFIKIDNNDLKNLQTEEERTPFAKLKNKRKRSDEILGVPVKRQNCFLGSLPGIGGGETEVLEEPASKKHKSSSRSETRVLGALRRTISRRFIRL